MSYKLSKQKEYGIVWCQDVFPTPVGRCIYPSLVTPRKGKDKTGQEVGEPKFEITVLLPKEDPAVQKFVAAMTELSGSMVKLFNEGRSTKISDVSPLRDGDEATGNSAETFAGCWTLKAKQSKPVSVYDINKEQIANGAVSGGMKVKLVVKPHLGAYGMAYQLQLVRLIEDDGVRLGGMSQSAMLSLMDDMADTEEEAEVQEEVEVKKPVAKKTGKQAALDIL